VNAASSSSTEPSLRAEYASALRSHLNGGGEKALRQAYDLGRLAVAERQSPLDVALLHHAVLVEEIARADHPERVVSAAAEFLAEHLMAFEMAYRGFLDASLARHSQADVAEREVRRVALWLEDTTRDLSAPLQAKLAGLRLALSARHHARIDEIEGLVVSFDQQLRGHARELYPIALEDGGLGVALQQLVDAVRTRTGLSVEFTDSTTDRAPSDVETCLYRAVQEILNDAANRPEVTAVTMAMARIGTRLLCSVRDNGAAKARTVREAGAVAGGEPVAGPDLIGIRERLRNVGGAISVRSARPSGTILVLSVPLAEVAR
jgi:signal transduction histidine kinase